jgi:predicted phage terminase large subunit-like protein
MLTRAEAAQQLLENRLARDSLIHFSQIVDIPGKPVSEDADEASFKPIEAPVAAHHRLLMETLQRISETPNGRAIVMMPPGSAKSTYTSVVFPAWFLGRAPNKQVILASYAMSLAKKMGRRTRQLVASPRYRQIFETTLAANQSAANEWALLNGSEYMAGGLLGAMTGNRADGLLIDDPMAGREEAESEVIRAKTWEAYQDDARTRLKPGGWRVIVTTRWHELDPVGQILPDAWAGESGPILCKDGHVWEVICLPAIADRSDDPLGRKIGEGLWPEWFKPGHWDEFKSSPRSWLSLYQQKPTAEQGSFYRAEWFQQGRFALGQQPNSLSMYMSGDFAVSEEKGDFTELGVWGVDPQGDLWALDWWHGQTTPEAWINALLGKVAKWEPLWFIGEGGVIRRAVEPFLRRSMDDRRTYVATEWLPSTGDKPAMARSFQAMCAAGKVHIPRTEWGERLLDQLMRFPNGRYDDACDTCALMGRYIADAWKATPKAAPKSVNLLPSLVIADFEPKPQQVETW